MRISDWSSDVCSSDLSFRFFRNKGQIVVPPTDAAIGNGNFDSNIVGWSSLSTGAALIDHVLVAGDEADLLRFAQLSPPAWGNLSANRANVGLRFTVAVRGAVPQYSVHISPWTNPFTAAARTHARQRPTPGIP